MAYTIGGERYLTETYEDKIESFVASNTNLDLSYEEATEVFLGQCETFEDLFLDETPVSAIQEQAFVQMKWLLQDES